VAEKTDGDSVALPKVTQAELTLTLTGVPAVAPLMPTVKVV